MVTYPYHKLCLVEKGNAMIDYLTFMDIRTVPTDAVLEVQAGKWTGNLALVIATTKSGDYTSEVEGTMAYGMLRSVLCFFRCFLCTLFETHGMSKHSWCHNICLN